MNENNKRLKTCKHCSMEIAKNAKVCPHCGGKNKKPIYKRWLFWIIIAILLAIVVLFAVALSLYGNGYRLSDDAYDMSAKEYKAACNETDYDYLARNAENNEGEKVTLKGEIVEVVMDDADGLCQYRMNITYDSYYDRYDDDIALYYYRNGEEKLIEGDIVKIYGECSGELTYTTVQNAQRTIPSVTAVYVKRIK